MKNIDRVKKISFLKTNILAFTFIFFLVNFSAAQSSNQNLPTPVTSNEISGTIRARSLGDSRLTNYFYTFNGNQGDVFINVLTSNLDGDIDIFTLDGLRPLTKIRVFSDTSDNETGRVVYLRKFEKLLLRIQGRTPNDDPATFQIKFAGSFQPLEKTLSSSETELPEINTENQGEVRVNSVGTIIEPVRKPTPEPKKEIVAQTDQEKLPEIITETPVESKEITVKSVDKPQVTENSTKIEIKIEPKQQVPENVAEVEKTEPQKVDNEEVVIEQKTEENPAETVVSENKPEIKEEGVENPVVEKTVEAPVVPEEKKEIEEVENEPASTAVQPLKPEQLKNIFLVVRFKDGKELKQPLNKVFSFNVNQGILTIVSYDGKVSRYSMLQVEKVEIQGSEN